VATDDLPDSWPSTATADLGSQAVDDTEPTSEVVKVPVEEYSNTFINEAEVTEVPSATTDPLQAVPAPIAVVTEPTVIEVTTVEPTQGFDSGADFAQTTSGGGFGDVASTANGGFLGSATATGGAFGGESSSAFGGESVSAFGGESESAFGGESESAFGGSGNGTLGTSPPKNKPKNKGNIGADLNEVKEIDDSDKIVDLKLMTEVRTGTEGSKELFAFAVCKLKEFGTGHDGMQWKIVGKGNAKIVQDADGRCRFIMNREKTGALIAHQHVRPDDFFGSVQGAPTQPFSRDPDGKKTANFRWTAIEYEHKDYNDVEGKSKAMLGTFSLAFNKKEYDADEFERVYKEAQRLTGGGSNGASALAGSDGTATAPTPTKGPQKELFGETAVPSQASLVSPHSINPLDGNVVGTTPQQQPSSTDFRFAMPPPNAASPQQGIQPRDGAASTTGLFRGYQNEVGSSNGWPQQSWSNTNISTNDSHQGDDEHGWNAE
jgi:hypothetical protein